MILPNPISYKNNRVSIRYMDNYDSLKLKAYGLYHPNKKAILLYKNLNKKELLNTFLHELMHLIGDKSKYKIRNFSEEKVCYMVGDELAKIFIRNPKVINFIKRCAND